MATRANPPKAAETEKPAAADPVAETDGKAVETSSPDPAGDVQDDDPPVLHTDTTVNKVAPQDGQDHGYIGQAHPDKNRDDYTVAGVTGGTAKAENPPQDTEAVRKAWAPLQS